MAKVTAEPWDLGDRITVYYHLGKHGGIMHLSLNGRSHYHQGLPIMVKPDQ